jgi:GT2 family glycosyltransferase
MISVVIATYNRADALDACLAHLETIAAPTATDWEVIVADNRSTDRTREVVGARQVAGKLKLRYLYEARPGKSYALNSGVGAAQGEIIAFTDDDCFVNTDWLVRLEDEFEADPALAGLGGRVELYNPADAEVSVVRHRERFTVASFDQIWSVIGCNMAMRRSVFDYIGGFDTAFSPGTKRGAVIEDIDFIYRVYRLGLKVIYAPQVLVYHNHGRRSDKEVAKVWRAYMIGRGAFLCKHVIVGDKELAKIAYWEMRARLKKILRGKILGADARHRCGMLAAMMTGAAYQLKVRLFGARA